MRLMVIFKDGDGIIKDNIYCYCVSNNILEIYYDTGARESISRDLINYYKEK